MDNNKTLEAIEFLEHEGEKAFVPECLNNISMWGKIGMAISKQFQFSFSMFDMIYEIAEDWNFHDVCAMINFVFHPDKYSNYLDKIRVILPAYLNKEITCLVQEKDHTYTEKRFKINVTIEEIG